MPHQRWGNPFEVESAGPTYRDLLRKNMRLRDELEAREDRAAVQPSAKRNQKANDTVRRAWIALVVVAGAYLCWFLTR